MELEFIEWLRGRLKADPRLSLGLSDDAALIDLGAGSQCLATVDMLADGVDFELEKVGPRRAGRKSLAVNLSDLAAMAARPVAALVALNLPQAGALSLAKELIEGMLPLAEKHGLAIAGGDTNCWNGRLVVSITAIGVAHERGPLVRAGARPGDAILVTGRFGGSILGRHLDFEPRVAEATTLMTRYVLHAGIDVSDGLSLDLSRMAQESGCGATIEVARVPIDPAAEELARRLGDGSTPLDHALGDGEDFELILAVPPEAAERMLADQPLAVPLTRIGYFASEPGLWRQEPDGSRHPLAPRGYLHGSGA